MRTIRRLALLFLLTVPLACAEERAPINRVQAVALQKSFFVGADLRDTTDDPEFYMRGTVIDVGYGAAQDGLFTSTYAMPVSRIRWEITENALLARLAYERIAGSDGKGQRLDGIQKKPGNDGQVVASYKIVSHFDVRNAYNPTTGERLNIIEENTTDRPWYEREYFRVDWSQNMATDVYDFDTLSMMGIYGGITYEPIPYAVTDENHPDAPHFDMQTSYFDVTTKAFAKPGVIDLSHLGWGIDKFPACYLPPEFAGGTWPEGNCNPVELTIRLAFKKVVDNDYEPLDYDGYRFQSYGAFYYDYFGYDRNYGMVDDKWFRFAARYNIWERSHYYSNPQQMTGEIKCNTPETTVTTTSNPIADPNRDLDGNGTADECEQVTQITGFGGSKCDVFKGKCTLPFQVRQQKTIPWHINGNTNEDLFEATNWATQEWDLAMKTAIQTSRLVECRRAGSGDCDTRFPMWSGQQDDYDDALKVTRAVEACRRQNNWAPAACENEINAAVAALGAERGNASDPNLFAIASIVKMQPVLVLCHNPVTDQDHPSCGGSGTAPRVGDLRYHTVLVIDKPQKPSAWGIMVDADDPVTGEKIAASINIWSHITDLAVQGLVDLVLYMNGELRTEDVTNGANVHNWVQAQRVGSSGPTLSADNVARRLAAATTMTPQAFATLDPSGMSEALRGVLRQARNQVNDVAAHSGVASPGMAEVEARMKLARGTPMEAKLINPAMLQLAGVSGSLALQGTSATLASPLGLNNPKLVSRLRELRENALAKRGACILRSAPEASSLTGIADIMKRKFPAMAGETGEQRLNREKAMHRYLSRRFHYAVIAHEMGHSVGLRHNFVSSYGALFFRPQYWQLRTRNGTVTNACTSAVADGTNCIGPRYFDPITTEEQDQLIWMFMQSSAMDYPGDLSQDMLGIGVWDYAGARMLYGDTVAVYQDTARIRAGSQIGVGITSATDSFGGLIGIKYSVASGQNTQDFHYSELQNRYRVISDCYNVTPQVPSWWRQDVDGVWDPTLDGHLVAVNGEYKKCRQMKVDYRGWTQLRQPTDAESGGFYRGGPSVGPSGELRVPYHFATDSWADLGNVSVFRHDNGADPYEQAMFVITTQENRHIFDNFRRNRTSFNVRSAADRSFSRYNEKLVNIAGGVAFLSNIYKNFARNTGYTFNTLWPFIVNETAKEQVLAATVAFDHLSREISRPEDGPHYYMDPVFQDLVLRSAKDSDGAEGSTVVTISNGPMGFLRDVSLGGRPLENALSENHGEYDTDYTVTAGSYYDKINAIIHMSISEDRFISQSRGDFYDARARANGMADILPEGYRRVIANTLVGDRSVMAPRVVTDSSGRPLKDAEGFQGSPMGWTSWWPKAGPSVCFSSQGRNVCTAPEGVNGDFNPDLPAFTAAVDPQIGWEVQKFVIAWALSYITANQQTNWLDMMRLYRLGANTDPQFQGRIEWQDPVSQQIYYARSYGKECLFGTGATCTGGQLAEKGIAARVLEWANTLTSRGYKLDTVNYPATSSHPAGFNDFGRAMVVRHPNGQPVVASDPSQSQITPQGTIGPPLPDCDQNINPSCTPLSIDDNRHASELAAYKAVPDYLWEALWTYRLGDASELGYY